MFNIVKFPNIDCEASGNRNGTCYTKDECDKKGGTEEGSCAQGYGVCCTFVKNCGAVISENNTYFESDGDEKGHCALKYCRRKSNIVQMRLDFENFAIAGPETDITTAIGTATSGNLNTGGGGQDVTLASRCITDVFSISSPGTQAPPSICGKNTGYHMYIDMVAECVDLTFTLSSTTIVNRNWQIRITQYESGHELLAPVGCTQYFWDKEDANGVLSSYNWDSGNGFHLADQRQVICIRREEGKNQICYSAPGVNDINISGDKYVAAKASCGGYKSADGSGLYRDALIIPSLTKGTGAALPYSNVCGQSGFSTAAASMAIPTGTAKTVCSKALPFTVTFSSDSFEQTDEVATPAGPPSNRGFQITYFQN